MRTVACGPSRCGPWSAPTGCPAPRCRRLRGARSPATNRAGGAPCTGRSPSAPPPSPWPPPGGDGGVGARRRVLDVGCGTGYLLRLLATPLPRRPTSSSGVDPAPAMVQVAAARPRRTNGSTFSSPASWPSTCPYPDATFDLVVSTTSFDHWSDQGAGLAECARVMTLGAAWSSSTSSPCCWRRRSSLGAEERHGRGGERTACSPGPGSGPFRGTACMPSSSRPSSPPNPASRRR